MLKKKKKQILGKQSVYIERGMVDLNSGFMENIIVLEA